MKGPLNAQAIPLHTDAIPGKLATPILSQGIRPPIYRELGEQRASIHQTVASVQSSMITNSKEPPSRSIIGMSLSQRHCLTTWTMSV